jgi:hypothetical protein
MSSQRPRSARALPSLPIVTAVAGALITAGCDAPARQQDAITRVCKDSSGSRVADENCLGSGTGGFAFAYVRGFGGAIGDRVDAPRSNPADVSRGGLGMSAHSSVSE